MFHLAENGQAAELRKLLTEEAIESVCVLDAGGRTPLNLAVLSGSLDTVKVGEGSGGAWRARASCGPVCWCRM